MAMDRGAHRLSIPAAPISAKPSTRGREWVLGLQSANGGWGAFDADNTSEYLNHIPFADHGALARSADRRRDRALRQHARAARRRRPTARALAHRARRSCAARRRRDGSWYGRWGMNYIYGTWSALCAFSAAGVDPQRTGNRARGELAARHPESRWRLGRGRQTATSSTIASTSPRPAPRRRPRGRCSA